MDTAIYAGINILSLLGFAFVSNSIIKDKKKVETFEKTKNSTPAGLIDYFQKNIAIFPKNPTNSDELFSTLFVEGYVNATKPLTSIINKKEKLIYSYYFQEEVYSNDSAMGDDRLKKIKTIKVPIINSSMVFDLVDPSLSAFKCTVHRNLQVKAEDGVELIALEKHMRNLNFVEKIIVFFGAFADFIAQIVRSPFTYRGIKIGWIDVEFGIRLDSALTVLGDVIYNRKDNTLRIEHPLYYVKDKSILIKKLKETIFSKKVGNVFLFVSFLISGYILSKKIHQKLQTKYKDAERKKYLERNKISGELTDEITCIICTDNCRNVICLPCQHLSMCYDCYSKLQSNKCPMCNTIIQDITQVFIN